MHILDYLLILILILMPIYSALNDKKTKLAIASGKLSKVSMYRSTLAFLWLPTAILLVIVVITPLTLHNLGLGFDSPIRTSISAFVSIALCIAASYVLLQLRQNDNSMDSVEREFENMRWLLPENKRQWKWFTFGISTSAGICEELLFRGYLMFMLSPSVGMVGAILLSSLLFGLNHYYQGVQGILRTASVGLVLALVYWLSGSLWFAIILHILLDVYAGTQAWFAFRRSRA